MMWILIYFALLSTVSCDDVNHFIRELNESVSELIKIKGEVVYCPDGQTQCPNQETCCKFPNGIYGCCSFTSGVCCSDHLHCCSEGTTCNLSYNRCDHVNSKVVTTLKLKVSAINANSDMICPDGITPCRRNGFTCCLMDTDNYGCCPFPNAVCCSNRVNCCPQGTTCNLSANTCDHVNNKVVTTLKLKVSANKTNPDITCPDGISQCRRNGSTCCLLDTDNYGCCPFSDAVCCSDRVNCCPQGTTCNLSAKTCDHVNNKVVTTLKLKVPAMKTNSEFICGKNGFTFCLLDNDAYGCCPHPDAVCCSNRVNCCPNGYECDLENMKCFKDSKAIISLLKVGPLYSAKVSSKKNRHKLQKMNSVMCSDGQSQCAGGHTCCSYPSIGCCVGVNAVCCSDKVHCCPENTICNLTNGTCDSIQIRQMFSIKSKTIKTIVKHTSCSEDSPCEEGYTCCPLLDSTYGCCAYTDAVCCSDRNHCCPSGTTCNLNTKTCDNEFFRLINRPFGNP